MQLHAPACESVQALAQGPEIASLNIVQQFSAAANPLARSRGRPTSSAFKVHHLPSLAVIFNPELRTRKKPKPAQLFHLMWRIEA